MRTNRRLVSIILALFIAPTINLSGVISGTANALDIFGFEVGNKFTYQADYYNLVNEITEIDQTTFPISTYILEESTDGYIGLRAWFEKTPAQLKLWGEEDLTIGGFMKFSTGLVWAWNPMQVGDQRSSSGTVEVDIFPGVILNVSLTVKVLNKEPVTLGFDTIEAYKRRLDLRIWGYGEDETSTTYDWVVPYLSYVKFYDPEYEETESLTSFSIGAGSITETTDTDADGLKDYQELIIYNTNRLSSDTDDDKMPDGWEVQYGLDPLSDDASLDNDADGYSNLEEYQGRSDPNDPDSRPLKAMPWIPLLLLDD